jgi:hypothetical protein
LLNRNRRATAGHKIYKKVTVDPTTMALKVVPLSERRHEFGGQVHTCTNYRPPKKAKKKITLPGEGSSLGGDTPREGIK